LEQGEEARSRIDESRSVGDKTREQDSQGKAKGDKARNKRG
jgi:hypothetical protein